MLDLTLVDVAQRCGVGFRQIQKYECGANQMSAAMIWRIATALDVDIGYFYDGLDPVHVAAPDARSEARADDDATDRPAT